MPQKMSENPMDGQGILSQECHSPTRGITGVVLWRTDRRIRLRQKIEPDGGVK